MNKKAITTIENVFTTRRSDLVAVSSCTTIDRNDPARISIDAKIMELDGLKNDLTEALNKEQITLQNGYTDEILDLIDQSDEITRSDLQGAVEAVVKKIMLGKE